MKTVSIRVQLGLGGPVYWRETPGFPGKIWSATQAWGLVDAPSGWTVTHNATGFSIGELLGHLTEEQAILASRAFNADGLDLVGDPFDAAQFRLLNPDLKYQLQASFARRCP